MTISRRSFFAMGTAGAATATSSALAQAGGATLGIDGRELGLKPDAAEDQTEALQRAIDRAAQARLPLILPPGRYRSGKLTLPPHARLHGVRGASRIELLRGATLLGARAADHIDLVGLVLDGSGKSASEKSALLHLVQGQSLRIADCEILNAAGNAVALKRIGGAIGGCTIADAGNTALLALDSQGLTIAGNTVRASGNNGIQVWRSSPGDDGTLVIDNRIEDTRADAGGNGPYGNAINVFRAGNVTVRGNRIRNAAFSAIRGHSASNIQISGNICTGLGEVAIYSEFAFEGAVIANNTVDGAEIGISVTNFDRGGRLAVIQGNLLRNLGLGVPGKGIGIAVEADSAVGGNVIENAPSMGIVAGYGGYLRDVMVSGNILRGTGIAIGVSVTSGAGTILIADNLICAPSVGAVVGMDRTRRVTGDLAREGAGRYSHVTLSGNLLR